jgi:hypothetical protein
VKVSLDHAFYPVNAPFKNVVDTIRREVRHVWFIHNYLKSRVRLESFAWLMTVKVEPSNGHPILPNGHLIPDELWRWRIATPTPKSVMQVQRMDNDQQLAMFVVDVEPIHLP